MKTVYFDRKPLKAPAATTTEELLQLAVDAGFVVSANRSWHTTLGDGAGLVLVEEMPNGSSQIIPAGSDIKLRDHMNFVAFDKSDNA